LRVNAKHEGIFQLRQVLYSSAHGFDLFLLLYYIIGVNHIKGGNLPAIQIKNVSPRVYKKLRENSRRNHRSVSGEVLYILEKALFQQERNLESLYNTIEIEREKIEAQFGIHPSSKPQIREDRDR